MLQNYHTELLVFSTISKRRQYYRSCLRMSFVIRFVSSTCPSFVVILPTLENFHSQRVWSSDCFSPIEIRPTWLFFQPVTVQSRKWTKNSFRVREPKNHDLLWPFKQIIWSFEYGALVSFDTETFVWYKLILWVMHDRHGQWSFQCSRFLRFTVFRQHF